METNPNNMPQRPDADAMPLAETGNASNPSPQTGEGEPLSDNAILTAGAEKYLREGGNVEDMPDAQDEADADEAMTQQVP